MKDIQHLINALTWPLFETKILFINQVLKNFQNTEIKLYMHLHQI